MIIRAYDSLPWWLQNLACSIEGLRQNQQRYGSTFRKAVEFLSKSQWWTKERLQEYQDELLRKTVKHAYETVPYYTDLFDRLKLRPEEIQTSEDLSKLPILKKETLRRRFDDLLCRNWPRKRIVWGNTGGTTGKALKLAYDKDTIQWQRAIWFRHASRFGKTFKDSIISFAGRHVVPLNRMSPPFWRHIGLRRIYVSVHHMTRTNMPILVDFIRRRKIDIYEGYPSALYLLARYMIDNALQLEYPPKFVNTGAETLLSFQRKAMSEAFNTVITDQYGASEYCANISDCEKHSYHVDMEYGVIEFLPLNIPGSNQCRIICTGLRNPVMPLIRYDIGDLAELGQCPCSCGRQSPTVRRIDGRIESYIITPDGRQLGRLDFLFKDSSNIEEAQIVQDAPDHVCFRIVRRTAYDEQDELQLLAKAREFLGGEVRLDTQYVSSIPREPNGKFRQIVSSISSDILGY